MCESVLSFYCHFHVLAAFWIWFPLCFFININKVILSLTYLVQQWNGNNMIFLNESLSPTFIIRRTFIQFYNCVQSNFVPYMFLQFFWIFNLVFVTSKEINEQFFEQWVNIPLLEFLSTVLSVFFQMFSYNFAETLVDNPSSLSSNSSSSLCYQLYTIFFQRNIF